MAKTLYTISAAGKKALEGDGLGTQATLVMQAISKNENAPSSDIVAAVEKTKKLETKQPVARVVGFYLAQFKADGLVKTAKAKEEKPAKKAAKPAAKKAAKKSSKKSAEPAPEPVAAE